MTWTLQRVLMTDKVTAGVLTTPDWPVCVTLELPWRNNQTSISCIPPGEYKCIRRHSQRVGGETFEVTGVPGRSSILFHAGNTTDDTEGCILPGKMYDAPGTVVKSRDAFNRLMFTAYGLNEFTLVVKNPS